MARCACRRHRSEHPGLITLSTDKAHGTEVVPDNTTNEQLAEMRANGQLVTRRSQTHHQTSTDNPHQTVPPPGN